MSAANIKIGDVIEVHGERCVVELSVDPTVSICEGYLPGQPGSNVRIATCGESVVGIVTTARRAGSHSIADCVLVGTLSDQGRFIRGVVTYPNIGQRVDMVGTAELSSVFSGFQGYDFAFGRSAQTATQRVYLNPNRFFSQHVAILGTTGCGKSCTVVSILQHALAKYPDTHIIVLDLHGEYSAAFPGDDVLHVEGDKLELPYWVLNFDEFQDMSIDPTEDTARNQATVLRDSLLRARQSNVTKEIAGIIKSVTVDSPVHYEVEELIGQVRNWNIQLVPDASGQMQPGPLYGVFDKFLIRLESRITDPRFGFMFQPARYKDNKSLVQLLSDYLSIDTGKRMAIIDLSGVPSEAVSVVVAVVSRMAFDFNQWNPDRTRFPILLVYEEAHNYVPNAPGARYTSAKLAVERVAKEGRKYGLGAMFVSQRPKELSDTVLAQCNNFVTMRLTNPDDQAYVRRLVPDAMSGLMGMLPALRTGEALLLGDAVAMPTRTMIDKPEPLPASSDIEFGTWWSDGVKGMDLDRIAKRWRARSRSF